MSRSSTLTPQDKEAVDSVLVWGLGVVLLGQSAAGRTETDIWGHVAIGLDMLDSLRFLWTDPYSFTHDQRWVNHEWLWDLVVGALYRSTGVPGLLALRTVLIGVVLWWVHREARVAPPIVRGLALTAVALVCSAQWQSTRPQLATLSLYGLLLLRPHSWWTPALFALWANVHGGWMVGLGFIGLLTLAEPSRRRIALTVACALATLLTPYGFHLWTALADALTRGWDDVSEWAPVWSREAGLAPLWIWLALVAVVAALRRRINASRWEWGWTVVTLLAAARSRRLLALAAVTAALLLFPRWRDKIAHPTVSWTPARKGVGAVVIGLALLLAATFVRPTVNCFPPTPLWNAPEPDAVAFIRNVNIRGRAVVYFDFGEYAIFHLRDRLKVSTDNRRETVYSESVLQAHDRFYRGEDPDYPARLRADMVWLPRTLDAVTDTLEQRGWVRRFEGPKTVVLLRTTGAMVKGQGSVGTPCFPYP